MSGEFIESLRLKFASGNGVPVDRASITRVEYDAIAGLWRDGCEMTDRWINCCQERNAAAELAAEHEAMVERMAEALEDCIDAAENSGGCTDGMAEALQEIRGTSREALAAYREQKP